MGISKADTPDGNVAQPAFDDEAWWSSAWQRHIDDYLAAAPRCGHWLAPRLKRSDRILEIAGGSCRDSRYLHDLGYESTGSDFDQRTLDYVKNKYAGSTFPIVREDAFAFTFSDKSFDVTFSNGFLVLMNDDADVRRALGEQMRITKRVAIALVHNGENPTLMQRFATKAKTDALYRIRFFSRTELVELARSVGLPIRRIRLEKFGGPPDVLYASKLKGRPNPLSKAAPYVVPHLYRLQRWCSAERLALTIELE